MEDTVKERLKREIVGIVLIAVALFLLLSLISYHPADPSFFSYATAPREIANWVGIVGAYGSALLFQGVGFPAFLIPLVLGLYAIGYILRWEYKYPLLKLFGWAIILLTTASLFSLWTKPLQIPPRDFLLGGILGEILSRWLSRYLNLPGATLLLGCLWVLGFVLGTGVSFFGLVRGITGGLGRLADRIGTIKRMRKERSERAQKLVQRRQARKGRGQEEPPGETETEKETPPPVVVVDRSPAHRKRTEVAEQTTFNFGEERREFQLPPISLLDAETEKRQKIDRDSLVMNSRILEKKLLDYGVEGRVVEVRPGPVITVYEFEPAPGVKVSRIVNLADDLALALSAVTIRIVAPIPGKSVVGIEVPNAIRETVYLKEIVDSDLFRSSKSKLTIGLGKDISGEPFVFDLAKMPHLLVAGSTGSGKSVSINAMINSILFKATPEEVRFIMIDPKMLELSDYDGIPHLLLPVVTHPKKAATALKWLVEEMERRYTVLAEKSVRNIEHYHQKIERESKERMRPPKRQGEGEPPEGERPEERAEALPYIVVVIDELADLMMVSSKEVEESITRLAQMARAVGIHLILATQRPSVDVLTGLIKANFPARISFQVTSKVDSRTILDTVGAEHLLGSGDMLFLPPGSAKLIRIHGAYISSAEIKRVVEFLKQQESPRYETSILTEKKKGEEASGEEEEYDEKYDEAVSFVAETGQASISLIQRRFRIGYNRAARIIEKMEQEGVVGPSDGVKPREVYVKKIEP
ncbi:MAG: DNA translocase FtsK 4TM domain-containing protein [Desulfobacterota bacterium]|nr:DNA translocase FtsK 4TM domain-containing protein [Thermodesulfobacteriota bacterium]